MKQDENTENEFLSELSPRLFNKKIAVKADPPEGYFDTFPEKMKNRIAFENVKSTPKQGKLLKFVNYRNLAIAAGFALILSLLPFLKSVDESENNVASVNDIYIPATTEINDLDGYFEDSEIIEALAESENTIFKPTSYQSDVIIDYLMYEDYNEDLLVENIQ